MQQVDKWLPDVLSHHVSVSRAQGNEHHRVLYLSFTLTSKTAKHNLREGKSWGKGDQSSGRASTTSLLLSRRSFCQELLVGLRHHVALRKELFKSDNCDPHLSPLPRAQEPSWEKNQLILGPEAEFSSLLCAMSLGQSFDRASCDQKLCAQLDFTCKADAATGDKDSQRWCKDPCVIGESKSCRIKSLLTHHNTCFWSPSLAVRAMLNSKTSPSDPSSLLRSFAGT